MQHLTDLKQKQLFLYSQECLSLANCKTEVKVCADMYNYRFCACLALSILHPSIDLVYSVKWYGKLLA